MRKSSVDVVELQPHELMMGLVDVIRQTEAEIGYYKMKEMTSEHLDSVLDETIKQKAKLEKTKLTQTEITGLAAKLYHKIMSRSTIQALSALSAYHKAGKSMSRKDLMSEKHKPRRLGRFMKGTGIQRAPNTAAHAIVSGSHPEARAARRILAKFKIRIDDPDNGVFLPKSEDYVPHPEMPDAHNHAKIHTEEYYVNITTVLSTATSEYECRLALRLIRDKLVDGSLEY